MYLFQGVVARVIPLLLAFSLLLVAARLLYDLAARRSRRAAGALFAAVLIAGFAGAAPYARRSASLLLAERAFEKGRWDQASRGFGRAFRPGAKVGTNLRIHWGVALMNLRRWRDAEGVLLGTARRIGGGQAQLTVEALQMIGICRFYEARLPAARLTLQAVSDVSPSYLADYFLARIAEREGDSPRARALYASSLRRAPAFFPALYQLFRLELSEGRRDAARALLDSPAAGTPGAGVLREALGEPGGLPPKEFFVVQHY